MPSKKSAPSKKFGKIKVLLVDDDEMARNAWKKVLSKSSQIQVVGEASIRGFPREIRDIPSPEVILTGFHFVEKDLIRSEIIKKVWGTFPKTIVVCEDKNQVKRGYKARADWAVASPFSDQELVTWIRALSADAKRLCGDYLSELAATRKGNDLQPTFLGLIQGILQLLFHPDLVNPEVVGPGRLIFRNQAKKSTGELGAAKFNEFWQDTRHNHRAKYVAVDVYNSEISPSAIQELAKYLTNPHGLFGMVIGRGVVKTSHYLLTVALFENEEKAILLLGDAELQEMLEYKAGGINPVCLLQDLYQTLIANASK